VDGFLHAGTSPNAADYDDRTALHLAVVGGHAGTVKLLLQAGADPHIPDTFGKTPLDDSAAKKEIHDLIQLALDGKHDFGYVVEPLPAEQVAKSKSTAMATMELLTAAKQGDLKALVRLRKKNADLGAEDYDGRTALH
jgi:ankyrin repeat protein